MEKKQTAMQEMLQWVRKTFPMDLDTPRLIEEKIESLLQKENQQIIDAYEYGNCDSEFGIYMGGEQFYEQTYTK